MERNEKLMMSYSKATTWLRCHKLYYWQYVEDLVPKIKSQALQTGDIVHRLRETWLRGELEVSDLAKLKQHVQQLYPENDDEQNTTTALEAATLFNTYVKEIDDSEYKLISPELPLELEFDDFILYSRLDGLATDMQNNIYRSELKTSKRMDSMYLQGQRKGLQTAIAHWLMMELFEQKPTGTLFEIIVKTKVPQFSRYPVMIDRWQIEYAKEVINGIVRDIRREDYYPSLQCSMYGRDCDFLPLCRNDTPARREAFYESYSQSKRFNKEYGGIKDANLSS